MLKMYFMFCDDLEKKGASMHIETWGDFWFYRAFYKMKKIELAKTNSWDGHRG